MILALGVVLLAVLAMHLFLHVITRHGQTYPVPDFANMRLLDAQLLAIEHNLNVVLTDSTYVARRPRGVILEQNPKPNAMVKKGRKVFVVVNTRNVKKVAMPAVVNVSLRQAKALLDAQGLKIGTLTFDYDIANGIVLEQIYRGKPIAKGVQLPVGTSIDLMIGKNGAARTGVPHLIGLSATAAQSAIVEAMLNVGEVRYDTKVRTFADSLNAVVSAQAPPSKSGYVDFGSEVNILLTLKPSATEEKD
ncbi:hypothetical protein FACS1894156_8860 [Bacteroidia bacterium]|nr:hypothetical protein FACS1894156_8860 [Bacteroidia bacterium]